MRRKSKKILKCLGKRSRMLTPNTVRDYIKKTAADAHHKKNEFFFHVLNDMAFELSKR